MSWLSRIIVGSVRAYQLVLSPLFAGACRYTPSCSQYMAESVRLHGAVRGTWLGLKRLARCQPFGGSGIDPVPGARSRQARGCVSTHEILCGRSAGKVR